MSVVQESGAQDTVPVWIGTGRSPASEGIYQTTLNLQTGKLSTPRLAAPADGPGFLAMHPTKPCLYTVCQVDQQACVVAYDIKKSSDGGAEHQPQLHQLNFLEIGGGSGTHLSVDRTGRNIVTAQYGGGTVALFSLNDDGSLKRRTELIQHQAARSASASRQAAPHPHWAGFSPDNRFVLVPDLGLDQVVIYRFDADASSLTRHGEVNLPPGSGPRHMKFHPDGRYVFVLNELNLTVTVFSYDAATGTMKLLSTVPTLPESERHKEQAISTSEIRVHPSGRFVYSANRGHDSISVFQFDDGTGTLNLVEIEPIRGATPRNFNLDPSGKWLLAAGQDSGSLTSFAVDPQTGELTYNRSHVHTPAAICVLFEYE